MDEICCNLCIWYTYWTPKRQKVKPTCWLYDLHSTWVVYLVLHQCISSQFGWLLIILKLRVILLFILMKMCTGISTSLWVTCPQILHYLAQICSSRVTSSNTISCCGALTWKGPILGAERLMIIGKFFFFF